MSEDIQRVDIETISSRVVYENRWMRVREDETRLRDGTRGIYGYVEKADFVIIVPIDCDRVHLVQQYRYPVRSRQWEFPQGSWDSPGHQDPLEVAKSELEEETGLRAGEITEIGQLSPLYGTCNQSYRIFLARKLELIGQRKEVTEQDLVTASFALDEFKAMICDGTIRDAGTVASFGLLLLKGLL